MVLLSFEKVVFVELIISKKGGSFIFRKIKAKNPLNKGSFEEV